MFSIESEITDGRLTRESHRRVVSRRVDYVEVTEAGAAVRAGAAPYLDYRTPAEDESAAVEAVCRRTVDSAELERTAEEHAVETLVREHHEAICAERDALVLKTMTAVKDRLTKEIQYWDHRAEELKLQELSGKTPAEQFRERSPSRGRAEARLEGRMRELEAERDLRAQPPVITGGCLVIPMRLLTPTSGVPSPQRPHARSRKLRWLL